MHATVARSPRRAYRAGLVLGLGLAACAKEPQLDRWEADYWYTEQLDTDGQHRLARERFVALRAAATDPRDADEAGLMACFALAKEGPPADAAACFDELGHSAADRDVRMRARMHAGELLVDRMGQRDAAVRRFVALCIEAPDTPAALRALDHLTLYGREHPAERDAIVALLLRLERRDPKSELADNLLLRAATLLEESGNHSALQRATELLDRLERDHAEDATLADGLVLRARAWRKLGQWRLEARDLARIVETFETSYAFASYSLDAHRDAALRLVELYRGPLDDLARAEAHARHLPEMLRRPVRILGYLRLVAELQEQRGDPRGALGTWRELLKTSQWRHEDYLTNDRRICDEEPNPNDKQACRDGISDYKPLELREVGVARAAIVRLEAQIPRLEAQAAGKAPP
ncbi:MAG: hypothetical protein EXR79_06300 [Myxococcales bacterium]|nr:hypothetical protein [Myxococcales bacterium]